DLRSSLRNHVHINPGGGDDFEDPGGNSDAAANVLADQADNRFVVLRFYLAKVLKIMQQQMKVARRLKRDGDTDFRRGHQIGSAAAVFEQLENTAQEAVV